VVQKIGKDEQLEKRLPFIPKPEVSTSHLAELSLIMDTGGRYSPEDIERLRREQQSQTALPLNGREIK
jgi:hypothetical protein